MEKPRGPEFEYEVDINAGKYKKFEKTCTECGKDFTLNVPIFWFDGNGKVKEHNLPSNISLPSVQKSIEGTVCSYCQDKEQMDKAIQQTIQKSWEEDQRKKAQLTK
jgi:hypothetical protein